MTREQLSSFNGRTNVTKITGDDGSLSYLTQSVSLAEEAYSLGATSINIVENEKKHVAFLFNSAGAEVGRYYLGKKLQGKGAAGLAAIKHNLCIFQSWNPQGNEGQGAWVPCMGFTQQEDLAATAVAL